MLVMSALMSVHRSVALGANLVWVLRSEGLTPSHALRPS